MEDDVVKHQWQIELGDRRVEPLKSISSLTLKQEYIQLVQNSADGKPVPDLVLDKPEFFGVRNMNGDPVTSEDLPQELLDAIEQARAESSTQDPPQR